MIVENLPSEKDILIPAMFAADMVLIIVAIALFSLASCPKGISIVTDSQTRMSSMTIGGTFIVSDALNEGGEGPELDAIFGDSRK